MAVKLSQVNSVKTDITMEILPSFFTHGAKKAKRKKRKKNHFEKWKEGEWKSLFYRLQPHHVLFFVYQI